jgi:hypothetical protein
MEYVGFDEAFKLLSAGASASVDDVGDAKSSSDDPKAKLHMLRDWFVVYSAILHWTVDSRPLAVRDMVSYLRSFVMLVGRNGFGTSYDYDKRNRQYCARAGNAPLSIFKADLWLPAASTPPRPAPKRKASFTGQSAPKKRSAPAVVVRTVGGQQVCFDFNKGKCKAPCPNKRLHVCTGCGKEHMQPDCKEEASNGKSS